VTILVVYALLPLEWRYSRALIFLGSLWALLGTLSIRFVLHLAGIRDYQIDLEPAKKRWSSWAGKMKQTGSGPF
jgi:hypothetical protein